MEWNFVLELHSENLIVAQEEELKHNLCGLPPVIFDILVPNQLIKSC